MDSLITSKEVLANTGISRATLNNYISKGILPKPDIYINSNVAADAPSRIGYFPIHVLDIIKRVDELKKQGLKMAQIAALFIADNKQNNLDLSPETSKNLVQASTPNSSTVIKAEQTSLAMEVSSNSSVQTKYQRLTLDGPLRLTLDNFHHPAYMVNRQFELEWCNEAAAKTVLIEGADNSIYIDERSIFKLFAGQVINLDIQGWQELLSFHVAIARNFLSHEKIVLSSQSEDDEYTNKLLDIIKNEDVANAEGGVLAGQINLARHHEEENWYNVYASFFREGIFFSYVPQTDDQNSILSLLARRDIVIRDLLKRRKPYLTSLAVLVADLQGSVKISAELPSDEYFDLINEIWTGMEPLLRKYKATHGKHSGDGVLYYFLPQPDSDYVFNAVQCAFAMRKKMDSICLNWTRKKNWLNRLKLNIGIDEGQEWFGSYQTPTHIEFTALGDTINNAGRLSDFAREGSIWLTKNVMNSLKREDQSRLTFGVRRKGVNGEEILVQSTFGRIRNLVQAAGLSDEKYLDVAALPVTEVFECTQM